MIGKAVVNILTGDAGVTALLSSATSVYANAMPQSGSLPAIVFSVITDQYSHTHQGPDDLVRSLVEIDIYATQYLAAHNISTAVRKAMDNARGSYGGVTIQRAAIETAEDALESPLRGKPDGVHRIRQQWRIGYEVELAS